MTNSPDERANRIGKVIWKLANLLAIPGLSVMALEVTPLIFRELGWIEAAILLLLQVSLIADCCRAVLK